MGRRKELGAKSGREHLECRWSQRISFRTGRHNVVGMVLVASHGHPAEHGVMNTGVYVPRGVHVGGQVDIHINMHAKIRTNVVTSIIYMYSIKIVLNESM